MRSRSSQILRASLVLALCASATGCLSTVRFPAEPSAYNGSVPSLLRAGDRLVPFVNAQASKEDIVLVSKRGFLGADTFTINPYEQIDAIRRSLLKSAEVQGASVESGTNRSVTLQMLDITFEERTLRLGGGILKFHIQARAGDWHKVYVVTGQGSDNPLIPYPMRTGFQLEASKLAIQASVNALLTDKEFVDAARLR